MKNTLFIITLLAVVAIAIAAFWAHQRRPLAKLAPLANETQKTQSIPSPAHILSNPIKMVAVPSVQAPSQVLLNPTKNDWSDIQTITDENAGYEKRLQAIGRLPSKLTDADWNQLEDFLLKPLNSDAGQLGQVLKNQLMDALCAMNTPPADLGSVFAHIYQNLLHNEVIRDYALQHLAALDETIAQNGNQPDVYDQRILWDALNETGDSIAGTALLGLVRLSQAQNVGIDQKKLNSVALQLADDSSASELTQITAYQVCAQLNVQDALPTIEAAAQDSQTISVQISAIGALGLLGSGNDVYLLQHLQQENVTRLYLPAQTAIQRIQSRLGQKS